jgi:DNA invertase Pin-like site-specific DNA recombinase
MIALGAKTWRSAAAAWEQIGDLQPLPCHPLINKQIDALKQAGSERLYVEKASGGHRDRPELLEALEYMRPGDTLVVWKLSPLTRGP